MNNQRKCQVDDYGEDNQVELLDRTWGTPPPLGTKHAQTSLNLGCLVVSLF